jgi:hypothetical protein
MREYFVEMNGLLLSFHLSRRTKRCQTGATQKYKQRQERSDMKAIGIKSDTGEVSQQCPMNIPETNGKGFHLRHTQHDQSRHYQN